MADDKQVAVTVRDIHKEFILPQSKNTSLKQAAVNIVKKNNKVTQKVLDGVSFEVNKGDFFGIVGRNGSGKSTLLKLLAGVYAPTSGEVQINGGLTPFIELGVGFNPELSGRDNIFLNGALLGFTRKQMEEMYDQIVEFAELGPFMDQKLKNYSSGMQVRLAFSVAIKAKNDIMVFDEVLAVGDEAFQRKCLDIFENYKATDQTVILVTHSMDTVKKYCNRAALIDKGKVLEIGDPNKVADTYSRLNQEVSDKALAKETEEQSKKEQGLAQLPEISITTRSATSENEQYSYRPGESMTLEVKCPNVGGDTLIIDLCKSTGEFVASFRTKDTFKNIKIDTDKPAYLKITLMVAPGKYHFRSSLRKGSQKDIVAANYETAPFFVTEDWSIVQKEWEGIVYLDHGWSQK